MGAMMLPPSVSEPLMLHGDCLDLLEQLPAESVDVVVTDPPAGIGFMSKPWDSFKGYKPRTARGRAMDSDLGNRELLARAAELLGGLGLSSRVEGLVDHKGKPTGDHCLELAAELREAMAAKPALPAWARGFVVFMVDVWTEVDRVLKPGGFVCAWALPKTADLAGLALRAVGWELHDSLLHLFGGGMKKGIDIGKAIDAQHGAEREAVPATGGLHKHANCNDDGWAKIGADSPTMAGDVPATDDASRWDGWHSQLAPGHEHWLLARKPTRLTYARQVLTHCTGGLHVDACRVPRGDGVQASAGSIGESEHCYGDSENGYTKGDGFQLRTDGKGSWPRNVLLSWGGEDCPAEALDRQSGTTASGNGARRNATADGHTGQVYGQVGGQPKGTLQLSHPDTGGASRFFTKFDDRVWYGGKAHRRDIPGSTWRIAHPTHKSPALMVWLVRLLAATCEQTGGAPAIVLDPFGGSFTTAWACMSVGVRCVIMEQDREHYEQGVDRVLSAVGSVELAARANDAAPIGAQCSLL